jgi:hypothetical protein
MPRIRRSKRNNAQAKDISDPAYIKEIVANLERWLLGAETWEIDLQRGICRTPDWRTGVMRLSGTDSCTITININGGAMDVETYLCVKP